MQSLSCKKLGVLLLVLIAFALSTPASAYTLTVSGTVSNANVLPNGRPDNSSCTTLLNNGTFYYTTQQFTVPASGAYSYTDGRYTNGTDDAYISIYTGTFDPANPLGGGCLASFDDYGTLNLTAGVQYTMMLTTWQQGITGPVAALLQYNGTLPVDTLDWLGMAALAVLLAILGLVAVNRGGA